jgi:peptidoglycan biosynthesis protein MviN/MurJ (putative lipid II flippase)
LKFPIVKLLLNYGNFDISSTLATSNVLSIMALGLIFTSLLLINLDTLFAMGDVYTPLLASFVAYALGAGLIYS